MTALSQKGKKRRKRIQLLTGNDAYGPLVNGKHNPRLSELPNTIYRVNDRSVSRYRAFIQNLVRKRESQH